MGNDTDHQRVRDLLPERYEHIDDAMRHRVEQAPEFAGQRFPKILWGMLGNRVTDEVNEALDLNVFGLFASAWAKGGEIRRQAKESVKRAGVPITLCLGKHKAATSLEPAVDVTLAPWGTHRIPFELALTAEFDTVVLNLLDGAIVSIDAGACRVTAELKLGGKSLHEAKKSPTLNLGRPYRFEPALQIEEAQACDASNG